VKIWIIRNIRFIKNLSVFIVAVVTNLISNGLYSNFIEKQIFTPSLVIKFLITCILFFAIIFLFNKCSDLLIEHLFPEVYEERSLIYANKLIKKATSKTQQRINTIDRLDEKVLESLSSDALNDLIESCYSFFESKYSSADGNLVSIKFEITFMTLSYIDNEITIPYSCNENRQSPTSMHNRKDNMKIYNNTETAAVYREADGNKEPQMRIIEDTDKAEQYAELYSGQKHRIKSSIIFPVLSPDKHLLGTIVAHCDKANFFRKSKSRYWREYMEIFSAPIGKEKLILDIINKYLPADKKTF